MLTALANSDPHIASAALAVALGQLVSPTIETIPESLKKVSREVIIEARENLNLEPDDERPESLRLLQNFLSHQADSILLGGRDRDEILYRLGKDGSLPIGIYEIKTTDQFKKSGESLKLAKKCVVECDRFQHLESDFERHWSLFTKFIKGGKFRRDQFIIVEAWREGRVLSVSHIWHLDAKLVEGRTIDSALDLLNAFVENYGLPLTVNGIPQKANILLNKEFQLYPNFTLGFEGNEQNKSIMLCMLMKNAYGIVNISYAYIIDTNSYNNDLKFLR